MSADTSKLKRLGKFFLVLLIVLVVLSIVWVAFSLIGRINADAMIPETASVRLSVSNPMKLVNGILAHESLDEIAAVPALAPAVPVISMLKDGSILKNPLVRLAGKGSLELAILPQTDDDKSLLMIWDMGLVSPLLRVLPALAGVVSVDNLYYVSAGKKSRFEYRAADKTFYIGPYRNLLFITDNVALFESRANSVRTDVQKSYQNIKQSAYDATLLLSPDFIDSLLSAQDSGIAEVMRNIQFTSSIEAGIAVHQKKLELRLTAPASSYNVALGQLLAQRSRVPGLAERLPASTQYGTIISAGTLEELYQAAQVFSGPSLDDTIRQADRSARAILGLTLNDLLFSWSGNEFAAFGMEGRPHPVYAIQITDERKRQEVFDKAFKSIVLNENTRVSLDGTRIPRIELPEYLQSLLRKWNLFLPSPYYIIHKDYLFVSESAEALLAALRAMQKNDVLPRTAVWKNIAGGRAASTAFSLYYSLDRSMPFFLRKNTAISGFFGVYRQGLLRMSFDRGLIDLTLAVVPGTGGGVTLVNGYPLDIGGRASNRVYGSGKGADSRIFLTRGGTAIAVNPADNSIFDLPGQGQVWFVPSGNQSKKNAAEGWVVSEQGRVSLVNGDLEAAAGFPVLTGLRISSPPVAHEGKLYLCDMDGKVHSLDANGDLNTWETSFDSALRSPPSFISVSAKGRTRTYAAVYPKSFFGEIWLLDADGKVLPNWPLPVTSFKEEDEDADENSSDYDDSGYFARFRQDNSPIASSGIGFGSPLLFEEKNIVYVAFVTQAGELSAYQENGKSVMNFPRFLDGVFYQQPIYDGEFLWLVSDDGTLFRVSLTGEVLSQRINGFAVKEEGYITFFDYDGDKNPEIFITGEGNALYAYSRNFRSLEGFPLPAWGKPLFVEAGGNAKAEIFGMGMDQRLYRWQFK